MPNPRARYPEEFKAEAVQLARSYPEKSIRQLSRELGISDQTLHNWVKQAEIDRGEREGLSTEEHQELRNLRGEVRILREEREILKKPQPSLPKRTGFGEHLSVHRGTEGKTLGPAAVPGTRRIALRLRRLEEPSAFG